MSIEFKLPALGENIESGDVTRVLVKVGDQISSEQSVLEMETGKASVEIPSTVSGIVTAIHVKAGTKAKVGQTILTLDPSATSTAAPAKKPAVETKQPDLPKKAEPAKAAPPPPAPQPPRPVAAPSAPFVAVESAGDRISVPAAPSTRQFAREIGIEIQQVPGSGPGGRISIEDIKSFSRANRVRATGSADRLAPPPLPDFAKWGEVERQPITNIRQATAEHLSRSWNAIPHVTLHDKADVTALEKIRQERKAAVEKAGGKLTLTAFLIKIAASALSKFPAFNSSIDLSRSEIIQRKYFHIGVAVDTDRGLLVPSIRDADKKSVIQIATELTQLSEKARSRKISPDDLQGGCFTITNLGSIGGGFFTPIISYPEAAILGVGRAVTEPVFRDGFFQPRQMMPLSLSFDHRIVDGADGARFIRWIVEAIEQPSSLALEG